MKVTNFKIEPIVFHVEEGHQIVFPRSQKARWRGWEGPDFSALTQAPEWIQKIEIEGLNWLVMGRLQTDLLVLSSPNRLIFLRSFYIPPAELRLPTDLSEWMAVKVDGVFDVEWEDGAICVMYAVDIGDDSEAVALELAVGRGAWRFETYSHRYREGEDEDQIIIHVASRRAD